MDGRDVEARPKEYLRKKGKNVSIEADDCVDVRGRMRGWLPECVCVLEEDFGRRNELLSNINVFPFLFIHNAA